MSAASTIRTEHNAAENIVSAHISWAPFARTALATAAAAAAAGLTGADMAPLWTADGFHLNADLSKALWRALSSAYVTGGSSAVAAAASGRGGTGSGHQLGWTSLDIFDLLRDEGAFGDLPARLQRGSSHGHPSGPPPYSAATNVSGIRADKPRRRAALHLFFRGEQANLMLDGYVASGPRVSRSLTHALSIAGALRRCRLCALLSRPPSSQFFLGSQDTVLALEPCSRCVHVYSNFDLPPTLYSLNPPTEEAEKLVSRWIDSAESTTMTGVAARALALAGSVARLPLRLRRLRLSLNARREHTVAMH